MRFVLTLNLFETVPASFDGFLCSTGNHWSEAIEDCRRNVFFTDE